MTWQNCKNAPRVHMPNEVSQLSSLTCSCSPWISLSNPKILPTSLFSTATSHFLASVRSLLKIPGEANAEPRLLQPRDGRRGFSDGFLTRQRYFLVRSVACMCPRSRVGGLRAGVAAEWWSLPPEPQDAAQGAMPRSTTGCRASICMRSMQGMSAEGACQPHTENLLELRNLGTNPARFIALPC